MSSADQDIQYEGKLILPKNRTCSDLVCSLIFVLSINAFIGLMIYGLYKGNLNEVFHSLDSDGYYCGVDERSDYPYMYRPTPKGDGEYYKICVKECPTEWQQNVNCYTNSYIKDCNFWNLERGTEFQNSVSNKENITNSKPLTYPSQEDWKNQDCLENPTKADEKYFPNKKEDSGNAFEDILVEISNSWEVLFIVIFASFLFSLVFLTCFRMCGKSFIQIISIFIGIILTAIGVLCIYQANEEKKQDQKGEYLVLGIIYFIVFFIFVAQLILWCPSLKLSANITESITAFIFQVPFALLCTPIALFWMFIFTFLWIFTVIVLHSQGEIESDEVKPIWYNYNENAYPQIAIVTIIYVWLILFVIGAIEFVIASCSAHWYYTEQKWEINSLQSFKQSNKWLFKQFGTVAFGSIFNSLFSIFTWIAEKMCCNQKNDREGEKYQQQCFAFYCNKSAYIQAAIFGTSYIQSGQQSLKLLKENADNFEVLQGLGQSIENIGQLFVCTLSTGLGIFLITDLSDFRNDIEYPAVLISVSFQVQALFVVSILISSSFFKVFSVCADTIIQCYLLDLYSSEKSKDWIPQNLHNFMTVFNKKLDSQSEKVKKAKNRYESIDEKEKEPLIDE